MATTTNYGWTTPDDTALVKDGAAAIRTLGSSIDTTTKNLNPSTTLGDIEYRSSTANVNTRLPLGTAGQVLKVNSGATAPEWATDSSGMTNPMTTTGDTIYSSSGSTPARLGIGSTGQVLTVAGGVPTWAAPAGGGKVLQVVYGSTTTSLSSSTTTFVDTNLSATITPSSTSSKVLVLVSQGTLTDRQSGSCMFKLQIVRGSTVVLSTDRGGGIAAGGASSTSLNVNSVLNYLDSPSTTSATTYKTQGATENASASSITIFQEASRPSTIILMEIGA
jgi:hypothetical protein